MAKKFDTQGATAKFFTQSDAAVQEAQTPPPQTVEPVKGKAPQGRPRLADNEKKRGKRYNLMLDKDLDRFLHEIVWVRRTNMTQYINDLIRADYEAYLKDCEAKGKNPFEGWENPNEA